MNRFKKILFFYILLVAIITISLAWPKTTIIPGKTLSNEQIEQYRDSMKLASNNTLSEEQIIEFKDYLTKTLKTHDTLYDYTIDIFPDEQYMRFVITGTRPEPIKEMTIAEIEKELGYKIKVIGDKT